MKSAKGGKTSGAAGARRICCACEIILLTIWRLWLTRKTAILDCSPGSHLLSRMQLKIHHRQQSGLIQYIYSGMFFFFFLNTKRLFFLLPLKQPLLQRVEIQPMVEIFMRKSAGDDEPQHNQGLYSPGSRGKSVLCCYLTLV